MPEKGELSPVLCKKQSTIKEKFNPTMYNAIICRYHEIATKGNNRNMFERQMVENIHHLLSRELDNLQVKRLRGRIWVEKNDRSDFSAAEVELIDRKLEQAFGLENYSPAIIVKPEMVTVLQTIAASSKALFDSEIARNKVAVFRSRARRSNKAFPLTSKDIEIAIASEIQKNYPPEALKINLDEAAITIGCEIRDELAIVYYDTVKGPGGLPVGVGGRVLTLLSGGIDSPVAAIMAMKRGCPVGYLSFHSDPYTPPETVGKVKRIAAYLTTFQNKAMHCICNISEIQKLIRDKCNSRMRTVLYRRMMFRIGEIISSRYKFDALLTGESIGQVASQTITNLSTIGSSVKMLIIRPLIGMDKLETIHLAERYHTFELSSEQVPDSCTVFAPDSPSTAVPEYLALKEEEKLGDYRQLLEKIVDDMEVIYY